jgi:multicomponent Na+:H+ antiporter subunit F
MTLAPVLAGEIFDTVEPFALGLLALAALLAVARILTAKSIPDRILGLDLLVVLALMAIAGEAARQETEVFLDVVVVISLVGFLATVSVARFVERRGSR